MGKCLQHVADYGSMWQNTANSGNMWALEANVGNVWPFYEKPVCRLSRPRLEASECSWKLVGHHRKITLTIAWL